MRFLMLLLMPLWLALMACSGPQQAPVRSFERTVEAFHGHLRWGRFDEAASFLAQDIRQDFLGEHDALGPDYQVTEVEVRRVDWPEPNQALVRVWIQSMRLPSTRVLERTHEETWEYDRDVRAWRITARRVL
jgi:hypothetical protein